MIIAVTAPPYPRRTALDRVIDGAGRAFVTAGTSLVETARRRIDRRRAAAPGRRAVEARRHAMAERVRDNTAQINPLGLR